MSPVGRGLCPQVPPLPGPHTRGDGHLRQGRGGLPAVSVGTGLWDSGGLAPGVPHFWGNGAAHAETLGVPGNKTGCFPAFCAADRGAGAPDPGSEPSPARFPAPRVLLLPPPPQQVPPSSVAWHVAEPPSVILEQSQDTTEQRRRGLPCDPGGQGPGGGPPGRGSPPGSWPCPFGSLGSPSGAPAVGAGLPPEPRGPEASTEARPAKATADVCRPSESHRWGPHATGRSLEGLHCTRRTRSPLPASTAGRDGQALGEEPPRQDFWAEPGDEGQRGLAPGPRLTLLFPAQSQSLKSATHIDGRSLSGGSRAGNKPDRLCWGSGCVCRQCGPRSPGHGLDAHTGS